ncbi:hypothetical protein CVT26_010407 [Gymnopilus dilepis]|uniref:Uncharacterized protein n=1 Tax=Gymnopilus dilepis TaxID=231916 RepID=A0A409VZ59_9AGAR|nr:hypothetical protein CVT26_010407 [Gymnopilus dilepis]
MDIAGYQRARINLSLLSPSALDIPRSSCQLKIISSDTPISLHGIHCQLPLTKNVRQTIEGGSSGVPAYQALKGVHGTHTPSFSIPFFTGSRRECVFSHGKAVGLQTYAHGELFFKI